ncbi:MAG TPA: DNA polymerase III subunit gamma/tau [Bacteroidia bacterium]|nr:DNA polymerase III subunit gamma/tau [Bacteroidia bacterium]
MEDFVVSARKYRPVTFGTVVGQHNITTTLKNAIKNHHLAQAFLFCGPRGVGKTTCARILAKTINCFHITENIEACNECDSCKSFNTGNSLNVYELDAASNNSVDDIRSLVEQVYFAPQLGKYKIYIIDEVHMLSQAAFNAFLKTLEEPPPYAIFILATTEKHKIIPTILSRCQIFDFSRIQVDDIAKQLEYVAKSEHITAEADALHVIAQKADGAMRDALSIFDQLVSFAGNDITYKAVIDNLNILDYDYYFKLTDCVLEKNIFSTLMIFNEIINNGFDGHHFISGLGDHLRNLLISKDEITLQLLETSDNIKSKYKKQTENCEVTFLLKALNIMSKCDVNYRNSKNQRLQIEVALMQLCSLNGNEDFPEKKNSILKPELKIAAHSNSENKSVATEKNSEEQKQNYSTEKEIPIQKVAEKKNISIASAPSISQFVNPVKKEIKEEATEKNNFENLSNQPQETFSLEALEKAWNNYALQHQKDRMNIYTTLINKKPILKENNCLEFTVDNKVQEENLNEEKTDLLTYLLTELKNFSLQLNILINKDETERKPYTAQDKFKWMADRNPNINKLKQQFDLEIDF